MCGVSVCDSSITCAVAGFGTYTYANKFFQYEGEWLNGKKHGEEFVNIYHF